jgi:hypothetical protein
MPRQPPRSSRYSKPHHHHALPTHTISNSTVTAAPVHFTNVRTRRLRVTGSSYRAAAPPHRPGVTPSAHHRVTLSSSLTPRPATAARPPVASPSPAPHGKAHQTRNPHEYAGQPRTNCARTPRKLPYGAKKLPRGARKLAYGAKKLPWGAKKLPSGARKLPWGAKKLPWGARKLPYGAKKLPSGAKKLPWGARKLAYGAKKLPSGARKLPLGATPRLFGAAPCLWGATPRLSGATKDL